MQKILIIGCGLIGFSLAKALKNKLPSLDIAVFDSDKEVVDIALSSNIADKYQDITQKGGNFDLVAISSPLSTYEDIFDKISQNISASLIIDLGSLNGYPLSIAESKLKTGFISCHPIAGSEKSGIENSTADLFEGKDFMVSGDVDSKNKALLQDLTNAIGSNMKTLNPKDHDKIFALTSHLPQFLSFLSSDFTPKVQKNESIQKAFRLNKSNPAIWREIFDLNSVNIEKYYNEFFDNLCDFIEALDSGNYGLLHDFLVKSGSLSAKSDKIVESDHSNTDLATILFRLIIVLSYVKIKDVNIYQEYTGSGFTDFTSIIDYFKDLDFESFNKLLLKNKSKIIDYFDKIST